MKIADTSGIRAAQTGLFLPLALVASHALCFNYTEHMELTRVAFTDACLDAGADATLATSALLSSICHEDRVAIVAECVGHMTALAGDYAGSPADFHMELGRGKQPDFLAHRDIDCHRLIYRLSDPECQRGLESLPDDCNLEFETIDKKLFRKVPRRLLNIVSLLTSNETHFMPLSVSEWSRYFDDATALAMTDTDLDAILATHSFALHFLQDSFSAGHNGLNRTDFRQDFDNGFHDTFNHTGAFLTNGTGMWHTYGDRRLKDDSIFLSLLDDWRPQSHQDVKLLIESLCAEIEQTCSSPSEDFSDNFVATLNKAPDSIYVISLDRLLGNFPLRPCGLTDSCNKSEFIWLDSVPKVNLSECEPILRELYRLDLCQSTYRQVLSASAASIKALFLAIGAASSAEIAASKASVDRRLPKSLHQFQYQQGVSQGQINAVALLLAYSSSPIDQTSGTPPNAFRDLSYQMWGLGIDRKADTLDELAEEALVWQFLGSPLCFKRENRAAQSSLAFTDTSELAHELCSSVSLKLELADSSGDFLDAAEVSMLFPFGERFPTGRNATFRNVFGIGGKLSIGIDEMWQGSLARNPYLGAALTADFHLGKQVFHVDIERLKHWNTVQDSARSLRFVVGWRGLSVKLSPE